MSEELFQTPVLFLIFNRKDTAQQVFDQIKKVKPAKLYVSADGPRPNKPGEDLLCQETRDIIKQVDWDCELHTRFLDENLGCGQAISSAITWMFEIEERGIILEDDCVPDITFFPYCEMMLERYNDDEKIMSICGEQALGNISDQYNYDYYYSRLPGIWGWATWRRAWNYFEINIDTKSEHYKFFEKDPYFKDMREYKEILQYSIETHMNYLEKNKKPAVWGIAWTYTVIRHNGLCITPTKNLITNIGDIGEHFNEKSVKDKPALYKKRYEFNLENTHHPDQIIPSKLYDTQIGNEYTRRHMPTYIALNIATILRRLNIYPKYSPKYHTITIGVAIMSKFR